jgi:hypothetical protein
MNVGNLLYWAAQVPTQFSGIVLFLFIVIVSLYSLIFRLSWSFSKNWAIWLNYRKIIYITTGLLLFALIQAVLLPYPLSPLTTLHLGFYLILYGAARKNASNYVSFRSINIVTWLNFAMLVGSTLLPIREVAFIEKVGGLRFESFYVEPSYAAFIYIFNVQQLWIRRLQEKVFLLLFVNFSCLLLTFSGSGLALLFLILVIHLSVGIKLKAKVKLLIVIISSILIVKIFADEAFDQMLISRFQSIVSSDIDNSTFLRFVAPWLFLEGLAAKELHFFVGTGIGGMVQYINLYKFELGYLAIYSGESVSSLNNGYAIIVALLGFPVGVTIILWMFGKTLKSKSKLSHKILFIAYPFFSGWIIHPLFFLLLIMSFWKDNDGNPTDNVKKIS